MEDRLSFLATYARIGRVYLRWAPFLLLLALLVFIPVGLVHSITIAADVGGFEFGSVVELLGVMVAVLALAITGLLGEVFYTGAVAAFLTHSHEDRHPTLREVARRVSYGRLIAVDLAYGAMVAIGLLLLVVPGLAAFVWFALVAPVVEIEDRGVRAALARSVQLIRGRFWTVLALLLPLELFGNAATSGATAFATDLLGDTLLSHWLADVLSNLVFTPLYAVAAVLITVTLIKEKEGRGPRLHSAPARA